MDADEAPQNESAIAAALRWRKIVAAGSTTDDAAPIEVVFVCTGNRFRSPLAAGLFGRAAARYPVVVRSAGTLDRGSPPVFAQTLEQARRFGLDLSEHRAQPLRYEDLGSADAVIGFEQMHVAVVVMEAGVGRDRAYTLPELVSLLELEQEHEPPPRGGAATAARVALERAAAAREAMAWGARTPEVSDPVGGSDAVFAQTADEIHDLVARLVRGLFG